MNAGDTPRKALAHAAQTLWLARTALDVSDGDECVRTEVIALLLDAQGLLEAIAGELGRVKMSGPDFELAYLFVQASYSARATLRGMAAPGEAHQRRAWSAMFEAFEKALAGGEPHEDGPVVSLARPRGARGPEWPPRSAS
jgi:hypothetical protein